MRKQRHGYAAAALVAALISGSAAGTAMGAADPEASAGGSVDALTETVLRSPAPEEGNFFGLDVAIDGDAAVVGEPHAQGEAVDSGVAWAYGKQDGEWVAETKLTLPTGGPGDYFGGSVAISGDTIVVGAERGQGDASPPSMQGLAIVYVRSGSGWVQQAQLLPPERTSEFGDAVAIDGDTIVVGAPTTPINQNPLHQNGAAYVYTRSGTTWTYQARLVSNVGKYDQFGSEVAIDGDTIVGAAQGVSNPGAYKDGALFVFVRSGSTWPRQAKVYVAGAPDQASLGSELDFDGDTIVAQAGISQPRTYVFVRSGATWSKQAELAPLDPAERISGGVAIKGNTLLAGNPTSDSPTCSDCGVTYVFVRSGKTWTQKKIISESEGASGDYFGSKIDFDGANAIISGYPADGPGPELESAGVAYIFER